jgi:ATP-dependent Lon protease
VSESQTPQLEIELGGDRIEVPAELPLLPVRNTVIFPGTTMPLNVGRPRSTAALRAAAQAGGFLAIVTQRDAEAEQPGQDDLHEVGTIARVLQLVETGQGLAVVVAGLARFNLLSLVNAGDYDRVRLEILRDLLEHTAEAEAARRTVQRLGKELVRLREDLPDALIEMLDRMNDPARLADLVAFGGNLSIDEKVRLLAQPDVLARLRVLIRFLTREIRVAQVGRTFQERAAGEIDETKRKAMLREQLRKIQAELGESDDQTVEVDSLHERAEKLELPEPVAQVVARELSRLASVPSHSPERSVIRTYVEWIFDLPWTTETPDDLDLAHARRILDEDHHGLEKIKDRILEYLAVRKLAAEPKGPILCFVGPPGVGKTSLGKSIARAMGRKFVRMSLGGVRDEAEIRGHRRTYVGALPGRIVQGLKTAGTRNPVFVLDEIDKVGADWRGDPSSALLEVLDPEQNSSFSDHYLELPFDLSRVLFITTANRTDTIPPPLLDRMELIELPGYASREKLRIATGFLVPRQLEGHGMQAGEVEIADGALLRIVEEYTREAGVRNLEREIAALVRKSALRVAEGQIPVRISADDVPALLGPSRFRREIAERIDAPGVAIGLVWTPVGGDIMFVEAALMEGEPGLRLTGQLGDVMKESGEAALSYLRANAEALGIDPGVFEKHEIHVHLPAGALQKEGPSAGIALVVALASRLLGRPVRAGVAMTGEITLRGQVLPVGGIKEKVLAAHRAGLREILLPQRNESELEEVPADVRADIRFVFVDQVRDALRAAIPGSG